MKKAACAALIFTMIIFLVNPLSSDARGYYGGGGGHSGYRGGGHGGGYDGWWLPWAIIGGAVALVSNSIALVSNSIAPASNYYSPYYAPPPVVIREQPQIYVQPAPSIQPQVYVQPAPSVQPSSAERMFVYPRQGQSEELQAKYRYECHRWAVSQTHYDATHPTNGMSQVQLNQIRADYQRAMGACLDAHGAAATDYQEEDVSLYLSTDTMK